MKFNKWLDTFIEEKEIDLEQTFEIETSATWHLMPVGVVIEHIKIAPVHEQQAIKHMLVKLDFYNANIVDYFKHLATALVS